MSEDTILAMRKISYIALYAETPVAAAVRIQSHIMSGSAGLDEGVAHYEAVIRSILGDPHAIESMNWAGASFSSGDWRDILQRVLDGIRGPEPRGRGV